MCGVRPINKSDLVQLLLWRNHPQVRRFMFTQHEISLEEHARWFERVSLDPDRHLLMFENENTPLGFINIHQINSGGICDWGFYAAPDALSGTGRALGHAALRYAFDAAGIYKLCGKALAFNEPSIRFHQSFGFQREGVLRHQHYDGHQYHDVICFGLLANEWQKTK